MFELMGRVRGFLLPMGTIIPTIKGSKKIRQLKKYSAALKIFGSKRINAVVDLILVVYALSANRNIIINFNYAKQLSFRCFLLHECRVDCSGNRLQINCWDLII